MTISIDAAMSLVKRKAANDLRIRVAIERIKVAVMSRDYSTASGEADDLKMLMEDGKYIQCQLVAADISEEQYEEMLEGLA